MGKGTGCVCSSLPGRYGEIKRKCRRDIKQSGWNKSILCITEELEKKFGVSDLLDDVLSFVELASQQGWLISDNANERKKLTKSREGIDPPLWLLARSNVQMSVTLCVLLQPS